MKIRQINKEVIFANQAVITLNAFDIKVLKNKVLSNKRKRIRFCAHSDTKDKIHEMIIVHTKNTYIRPHKHLNKSESFHVIEGLADVIIFNNKGQVKQIIQMGDYKTGAGFYFRISDPHFHTLIIKSDFFIFHETTSGPLVKSDTIYAPWAPDDTNEEEQKVYIDKLSVKMKSFLRAGE